MIRKTVSLLLCAALLAAVCCAGAESAFDGGVFAGKTGYTSLEDGGWTYVRGAELPYPGFVIAIRISVSGGPDGTVDVPRLEVGLLKSIGSGEAAAPVSGVTFYAGDRAYTYEKMQEGDPYAAVPLFEQGKELAQALAKATDLTVRVYYSDKSVYDISNIFRGELAAISKDLLNANLWDYLSDADGQWAAAEAECPLAVTAE